MNVALYVQILEPALLPAVDVCFMVTSTASCKITIPTIHLNVPVNSLLNMGLTGGKQSPDLNSIENLWHELKEYIRHEVKCTTKRELIDGELQF